MSSPLLAGIHVVVLWQRHIARCPLVSPLLRGFSGFPSTGLDLDIRDLAVDLGLEDEDVARLAHGDALRVLDEDVHALVASDGQDLIVLALRRVGHFVAVGTRRTPPR